MLQSLRASLLSGAGSNEEPTSAKSVGSQASSTSKWSVEEEASSPTTGVQSNEKCISRSTVVDFLKSCAHTAAESASYQISLCRRCSPTDFFEGHHQADFDTEMAMHHPGLKELMEQKVIEQGVIEMTLVGDVYNVYFLSLIKKQEDGQYLHVDFPRFYGKNSLGGWPIWTFSLQTLSCIFALRDSLRDPLIFGRMFYTDWCMLLVALFLNQYAISAQMLDLRILEMRLKWLMNKKREKRRKMYQWLSDDRVQALRFIIQAKAIVIFVVYTGTNLIVMTKTTALDFLKNIVIMSFVNYQARIGYQLLVVNNARRQLGHEGTLYTGLADFNLKVELEERVSFEKQESFLWWFTRIVFSLCTVIALLRVPLLHDITFGPLMSWRCEEFKCE